MIIAMTTMTTATIFSPDYRYYLKWQVHHISNYSARGWVGVTSPIIAASVRKGPTQHYQQGSSTLEIQIQTSWFFVVRRNWMLHPIDALSCRGNLESGAENRFCTNSQNLHHRLKSFSIKELSETLQDAVRVTENLGVQFLWIDSLCILQDKDKKDWELEAPRMEDVFASACCTIAATSATNSSRGFLERHSESQFIQVQDGPGRMLYVCEDVEDFDSDVENAVLNTRGWVLQE